VDCMARECWFGRNDRDEGEEGGVAEGSKMGTDCSFHITWPWIGDELTFGTI